MSHITFSARSFQQAIERKAFAYGISPVVAFLLGEYAVDLLKSASREQKTPRHMAGAAV